MSQSCECMLMETKDALRDLLPTEKSSFLLGNLLKANLVCLPWYVGP